MESPCLDNAGFLIEGREVLKCFAVPEPDSNAAGQHMLYGGEDGSKYCPATKELETLLGFLCGSCVKTPGKLFVMCTARYFKALDQHMRAVALVPHPAETINNNNLTILLHQ